jgi:prevent-host-death family protein
LAQFADEDFSYVDATSFVAMRALSLRTAFAFDETKSDKLSPMTETVNVHVAKTQLSSLLDRVARGEEIIIAKAGKPIARLVPLAAVKRPLGFVQATIDPAFFDPLPEEELAGWADTRA